MPDYKAMYAVLCKAADKAIDILEHIPGTQCAEELLHSALLEAEEIYIATTLYAEGSESSNIIDLKLDD